MTPHDAQALRDERDVLTRENASLRAQLEHALAETERLRRALDEAERGGKRQAAPFSRNTPKANPQPPGRKAGAQYGVRASRPVPARVDEQIRVPVPPTCRHCGGAVRRTATRPQFHEDLVRQTIVRRFDVAVGRCGDCGRHVQGRHPLQTADALGAAHVQVGPEAIALAAQMTKELGSSMPTSPRCCAKAMGYR